MKAILPVILASVRGGSPPLKNQSEREIAVSTHKWVRTLAISLFVPGIMASYAMYRAVGINTDRIVIEKQARIAESDQQRQELLHHQQLLEKLIEQDGTLTNAVASVQHEIDLMRAREKRGDRR